tara:strand:+ start:132 stop:332 length:201 start_codon:yes stop_codon:yes gene_type:complete
LSHLTIYVQDVDISEASGHEAGGILKMYLRDQDAPLIPFSQYDSFIHFEQRAQVRFCAYLFIYLFI